MFCTLFLVWRELFLFVLNLRFFCVFFCLFVFLGFVICQGKEEKEEKRRREARDFRVPFGHMGHRRRQETLVKKSLEWSDFFFLSLLSMPRHGLLCGQEHVCQIMGHTLILCKSWMGR